jgi:hypothetical protein
MTALSRATHFDEDAMDATPNLFEGEPSTAQRHEAG